MIKRFLLIALIFCFGRTGFTQSNWSDDFSAFPNISGRQWSGDVGVFAPDTNILQLSDSVANEISIYTYSTAFDSATWIFSVQYDFAPSSANFASVFLSSSTPDFWGETEGYFIRVGGGSQRTIALIRRNGTSNSILFESVQQFMAGSPHHVLIKVMRSRGGQWSVYCDTTATGNQWMSIGTAVDNTYPAGFYFGFACRYTVTRADKMAFGPISVSSIDSGDSLPVSVDRARVIEANRIALTFSGLPDASSVVDAGNYTTPNGFPEVLAVQYDLNNPLHAVLELDSDLPPNEIFDLDIIGINSVMGILGIFQSYELVWFRPSPRDIIINELMIDPSPAVKNLPETEYIELYNNAQFPIHLLGWQLQVNNQVRQLGDYILPPDTFVVLTREADMQNFSPNIPVLGIDISPTALTNASGEVRLFDPENQLVDFVFYDDSWYRDIDKASGGWSLEHISVQKTCRGKVNWKASVDPAGGTPGRSNSLAEKDVLAQPLSVQYIQVPNDNVIAVHFSEALSGDDLTDPDNYLVSELDILHVEQPQEASLMFTFNKALDEGRKYQFQFKVLPEDCLGRQLQDTILDFGFPKNPEKGELIINEVLPAPFAGGVSFVEIKNVSSYYLQLRDLRLGNYSNSVENDRRVVDDARILAPGGVLFFATDVSRVVPFYTSSNAANGVACSMPSTPNESGGIALINSAGEILDSMNYHSGMHSSFLREFRGVSLERISSTMPSMAASTWVSAGETYGWGTPGVDNLQSLPQEESSGMFTLAPEVLKPNNSGIDDVLEVRFLLPESGCVGDLQIFDINGHQVAKPVQRAFLPSNGALYWDGNRDDGHPLQSGLYIAILEVVHASGQRWIFKDAFGVIY
ncbi:MAG: lamin tail domain-containing protein [Cryomorphaceae bacterium]|nr:lamin tail domain-containing protein [Cryomorphaceae bacterium]